MRVFCTTFSPNWLCALLFCLPVPTVTLARHIVGGDMYYEHLGGNRYRVVMKVYRDCLGGGAEFDNPAAITVYANNIPGAPFANLNVPLGSVTRIPPVLDNPCLSPPSNICVEEGIYRFELNLPFNAAGYTVSYQRCCRNNTINNLINPGDVGSTYTINISGLAQQIGNNSPRFKEFPPIVICANEPLSFDHSATDPEGHRLVYRLCAPLQGGGPDLVNVTSPGGVAPNPATAPPYSPVLFRPPHSGSAPMAATPAISIDPTTGVITGTPTALGQFVVGVCVEEYDAAGNLLGVTRRDFQFNVVNCVVTVFARIRADEQPTPDSFVVRLCGSLTVPFVNQSGLAANIQGYRWVFDLGSGTSFVSTATNPTVTFPAHGVYGGFLVANPGSSGCTDTAHIRVEVFPDLTADFSVRYDTCAIDSVRFTDLSVAAGGPIVSWLWSFGDGSTSNQQNPAHLYTNSGDYTVRLTVVDVNGCRDTREMVVRWYPETIIRVAPDDALGCEPFSVQFINNSYPIAGYTLVWYLGDGTVTNAVAPQHTYLQAGTYSVGLRITSPLGCVATDTFPALIRVSRSPRASFTYSPERLTNLQPTAQFTDLSSETIAWHWDFGTGDVSTFPSPVYTFPDTGLFRVTLTVTHPSGCQDTTSRVVDVVPLFTFFLPNAFTPNADGRNDVYRGAGIFFGVEQYEMLIFNRWGECVFESKDPYVGWNGQKSNTGFRCPAGVYPVVVHITGERGKKFTYTGVATLVE